MPFIGTPLDTRNTFQSLQGKRFDGDGSTTDFTLDVAPSSTLDIEVFVENVRQDPNSAYTLSGTTLSFTGAPPSGTNNIYVVHQAKAVGTIEVPATYKSDAQTISGARTFNGGVVFNEDSADLDFRVESNGDANIIKVDGGNDKVGIGETSPAKRLHIKDTGASNAKHVVLRVENADTGDSSTGLEFITNRGSTAGSTKIYGAPEDGSGTASLQFIGANHFFRNQADSSNYLAINSNGRITRHQSTTSGHLNLLGEVGSSSKAITFAHQGNGSEVGTITTGSSSTAYNTSSDYRLKENVTYSFDATSRLKQLKPARFNFITDETNTLVDGFLAHEVSSIVPEAITGTHNEVQVWEEGEELPEGVSVGDNKLDDKGNTIPVYQGIDQSKLVPLLVKTIQELEARITALEE